MGLFDKLIRKDKPEPKEGLIDQESGALAVPDSIEKALAARGRTLGECVRVHKTDAMALGVVAQQLMPLLHKASGAVGNGSLVRVEFPKGVEGTLATLKSTGETIGTILTKDGGLAQARLKAVDGLTAGAALNPTLVPLILMTAMLADINHKLDKIQAAQQQILSFLEQDKQAEQQANLNMLMDILKGYSMNWENEQYRMNHHMKVLDIKQAAEKNILFYREQVAQAIKALPGIHVDQQVREALNKLGGLFRNYRTALYLFAFSTFLDVLLLGNFREEYLNQEVSRITDYADQYRRHFTQCGDMIRQFSQGSIQTQVTAGIGNASVALGRLIASSPLLSRGPVDEWLQDNGERILKDNDEKIGKAAAEFAREQESGADAFVDCIRQVSVISNHTEELLFDGETMYVVPGV